MDMFGPLYQVMFSSMTTRAAHLDLANDKTADAFFMAFRRFASLRAPPPLRVFAGRTVEQTL